LRPLPRYTLAVMASFIAFELWVPVLATVLRALAGPTVPAAVQVLASLLGLAVPTVVGLALSDYLADRPGLVKPYQPKRPPGSAAGGAGPAAPAEPAGAPEPAGPAERAAPENAATEDDAADRGGGDSGYPPEGADGDDEVVDRFLQWRPEQRHGPTRGGRAGGV